MTAVNSRWARLGSPLPFPAMGGGQPAGHRGGEGSGGQPCSGTGRRGVVPRLRAPRGVWGEPRAAGAPSQNARRAASFASGGWLSGGSQALAHSPERSSLAVFSQRFRFTERLQESSRWFSGSVRGIKAFVRLLVLPVCLVQACSQFSMLIGF